MKLVYLIGCIFWSAMAVASPFQVTPMRLELESGSTIGSVTIFNSADKPLDVQVKAKAWTQDDKTGADVLKPTKSLVFFPKIFKIPPHGKQNVRVGSQDEVKGHEQAYRLFIRELPVKKPNLSGAQFVLQISMPVFIYPVDSKKPRKPTMQSLKVYDGKLMLEAVNESPRYYSLNKIEILGMHANQEVLQAEQAGWYVLSGSKRLFPLPIDQEQCLKMDTIQLTGHVLLAQSEEGDTSKAEFPITSALCENIHHSKNKH